MSHPRVAKEFFESYLPATILKKINLDTLQLRPGTFVDEELQLKVTDALFSVDCQGKPAYLYTLVEHLRNPDRWMAFRRLQYQLQIMDQHRKETGELPIVYVLVLYNGEKQYPYSTDIFDLFAEHKALAQEALLRPFKLIDLSQISDKKLKHKAWSGMFQLS
jgi:predicted transposase/invertase (TIGR01784 family)